MAYQYWQHQTSGDVFAVEIEDGTEDNVMSAFGPIHYSERTIENLPDFDYNYDDGIFVSETLDDWRAFEDGTVVHLTLDGARY
jgi:hypothetical protein